ncbi:type I glutamate--ammonia ligase [Christensenellaceae bacterium OttesenSCG-928-K19]|nr:type I glutamate--ammonia ligase [Christensenellaceae bacterium OttesenSCG-928-K19]
MFKTLSEAKEYCKKNEIMMVDFMMIDLNGRWRHLTMPVDRLTQATMEDGIGFDGSNYSFAPIEASDMVFIPDLSTAYTDLFAEVPTLAMIGDVYVIDLPSNRRFDQDPRNVAFHAEEYLKNTGIADEMRIGPEFEFHVFDHVSYAVTPNTSKFHVDTQQAEWNTGIESSNLGYKMPKKGGYHMAPPMDILSGFRSRVSMMMEKQGIPVKYHHHEVGGPGQLEIEVEFGGMREMADKTMMTKYIIKNAAVAEGKTVTFMPKPIYGEAGNGMHVHMHLFKKGKPVFYDKKGYSQLSDTALYFIGGLLKHAPSLCAFTNPSTNSYKRLVPGYEAPVTIGYATSNRSAVIRIPAYAKAPADKRFELRCPDGTCNPYYAYSAILMAGIDGIKKKIDPEKEGYGPYDFNLYNLTKKEQAKIKSLPQSLDEALDALEKDNKYLTESGVFPKKLIEIWIEHKRAESARYNEMPQPVEYDMYYDL